MVHQTCAGRSTSMTPTFPSIISAAATGPTTIAAHPFSQEQNSKPHHQKLGTDGTPWQSKHARKQIHAFDAAEQEGGAEGEDHVRDAQRVVHRPHGLRVLARHPRLHRAHRSPPPRLLHIQAAKTSEAPRENQEQLQLSAALAGRRAQRGRG